MPRLRPQTATSLVDLIAKEIKVSILAGKLRSGEPFSIAELSAELGVSHIPVREALRRLEADGLVLLRPSRSAIVTPLGVDELEEIYQLRRVLEADLAARSAPLYTAEQLELAESLCEELRLSAHGVGDTRPSDAHHRLHELLLQPAAGEQAGRILSRLWDVSDRYIALVYHVRPIGSAESYHRHTQLVSVAKKRKGPLMRDAVAEHLNESFSYMTVALKTILNPSPEPVEAGEGEQGAYPVVAT